MTRRHIILLAVAMSILTAANFAKAGSPPTASIESPDNPVNTYQGATIEFTIRGADPDGDLRLCEIYLTPPGGFQGHAHFNDGYNGTATWSHTFDTIGTYTIGFISLDGEGNYGTGGAWTVEVGPPHNPTASIVSPNSPVQACAGYTVYFVIHGEDPDGDLRLCEVYLAPGGFQGHAVFSDGYDDTVAWGHKFDTIGTYTLSFNPLDGAGHYGTGGAWIVDVNVCSEFGFGTLAVTIEPNEAVDSGAKWKVAGYTEWLDSGQKAYDLPPGYVNVDFNDVEGWIKPQSLPVRVIGDVPVSETVEYTPIPVYAIGEIPPLDVLHGEALQLYLDASWLAYPSFTMEADPVPIGPLGLDPVSGLFTYEPNDVDDRTPFDVNFTATSGIDVNEQTVEVTPIPDLPAEHTIVSRPSPDFPDPNSRDYIFVNEILSDSMKMFNGESKRTRSIAIAGKAIICEDVGDNPVYVYHDNGDINDLTIYAETLIIRDPLYLPQTNVTIYARDLRFEGDTAGIDTTPIDLLGGIDPPLSTDGEDGIRAGDIALYIESFDANPTGKTRFIMNGTKGQNAGVGAHGINGGDFRTSLAVPSEYPYPWVPIPISEMFYCCCGDLGIPWQVFWDSVTYAEWGDWNNGNWELQAFWPVFGPYAWVPTAGTSATPPGKPGSGGDGGVLNCTLDVLACADVNSAGGASGAPRGPYYAGADAFPKQVFHVRYYYDLTKWRGYEKFCQPGTTGAAAKPPDRPSGSDGGIVLAPRPLAWLTPYALKMVLAHARDAYLYGYAAEARDILDEYHNLLDTYMALPEWYILDEQWQLEFEQMHGEIITLLHRLENGLDYFGNPPDWVPMLSFEVLKEAYDQEIDSAIDVMYLSYWVRHKAETIADKQKALRIGRTSLWDQAQQFKIDCMAVGGLITQLKTESAQIAHDIGTVGPGDCAGLLCELKNSEEVLLEYAKLTVQKRNEIPKWQKYFRVIGTVVTAGVSAFTSMAGKDVGGVIGANTGLYSDLSDLADEFEASDHPFEDMSVSEDVAKKFSGIDFDEATSAFNEVDISDMNTPEQYLTDLRGAAADIADGMSDIKEAMRTTTLSNKEVEAELAKVKAAHPAFNNLVDQVTELMARKVIFNRQLGVAMQKVAALSNGITNNLLAIDAINRDMSIMNKALDPRTVMYVRDMEQRARDRLLKYHYYMAKAYEYRLLDDYNMSQLNVQRVYDEIVIIAEMDANEPNENEILAREDFETLKALYEGQLADLTESILDAINYTEKNEQIDYALSAQELNDLNAGKAVTINFVERGLFPRNRENLRIVDLQVSDANVTVEGNCGGFGHVLVTMKHPGLSTLQWRNQIYLFTQWDPNEKEIRHATWESTWHLLTGEITHPTVSAAQKSLLWSLLGMFGQATDENALLFSRPAAWADIEITKEVNYDMMTGDPNCRMNIDELILQINYDYYDKAAGYKTLQIMTSPRAEPGVPAQDLLPYFVIDSSDTRGCQDGIGNFFRIYPYSAGSVFTATVTAPQKYGNWEFFKWVWSKQSGTYESSAAATGLYLDSHTTASAQYQYVGPMFSPADFDRNAYVDFEDYTALSRVWLTGPSDPEWDALYDVSDPPDDYIDWRDVSVLCENWLASP